MRELNSKIVTAIVCAFLLFFSQNLVSQNLVVNGDFSSGNTGFTTGYVNCNTANCLFPFVNNAYAIGTNPNFFHTSFFGQDHTSGTGNMMIFNGGLPNLVAWSQTIIIMPGQTYSFSIWACSVYSNNIANLNFSINGISIGILTPSSSYSVWSQYSTTWNAGVNTTATLSVNVTNTTGSNAGVDFGLDDIYFGPVPSAQPCSGQFPNINLFNTATNATGNGTLSLGSSDLNWMAAFSSSLGPYVPAQVVGNQFNMSGGWVNSPYANCNWISYPYGCGQLAVQSCSQSPPGVDIFYKLTFNLPANACGQSVTTPSAYCLSMDFYADNSVYEIFVNGVLNYQNTNPNPYFQIGYGNGNQTSVTLCNNWQVGSNSIIVHVRSGYVNVPFNAEGFLAQVNQSTNIVQPVSANIALTNGTCNGVGSATAYLCGGTAPYTYSWLPAGGSGSVATNLSTGTYTSIVQSSNLCTTINTFAIIQAIQPTVNISASSLTTCVSNPVTLTAIPVGGGVYTYTWTPSINTDIYVANQITSGTYTYNVSVKDSINCLASKTIAITFFPTPTLLASSSTLLCHGDAVTFSVNGANTYTWQPGNQPGNTFTTTLLSTTIYSVAGTATTGCMANTVVSVAVPALLQTSITASSATVCVGSSITITANSSGGTGTHSFAWSTGSNSNSISVSEPAGNYLYTVQTQDQNLCTVTQSISLDFIPNPTISVINTTVCYGGAATLTVSGANSYTWNIGALSANPVVSPTVNTVYTATGSALGCTSVASGSVQVLPIPTLTTTPAAITCTGLGSATVEAGGTTGPYSYTWMPTAQTTSNAIGMYPGVFTITVMDYGTGCVSATSVTFTPLVPLTGTVSATNSLICNGATTGTANIVLSNGSGSQNYSWTNVLGTQSTPSVNLLGAGVYTVTVIDNLTYCTVTQTFLITQPPALTLNVSSSSPTACTGNVVTLNANASGGTPNYTYSWNPGPSSNSQSVSFATNGLHIYTITSKDFYNCSITKTISVNFITTPTISASNATICQNALATLTVVGANSYTWYPNSFVGNILVDSPNSTTTYTVEGNSSGCTAQTTASVLVYPLPVPVISAPQSVCSGYSLFLSAGGGVTYLWNGPAAFSSTLQAPVVNPVSLSNSGSYSLTAFSVDGCTVITQASVTVMPSPTVVVSGASVCLSESAILHASGGGSYQWSGPNNFSDVQQDVLIPVVDQNSIGIYTVVITGTNLCVSTATAQLIAYPYPLPIPVASGNTTVCMGSVFQLNGSGGVSYYWQGPQNFSSSNPNIIIPAFTNSSGTYTLSVKNASNCSASTTVQLQAWPLPNGILNLLNNNRCVPFCSSLSVQGQSTVSPIVSVSFRIDDSAVTGNSVYCLTEAGSHFVTATFKDTHDCVNSSFANLTGHPKPEADFYFTPKEPLVGFNFVEFRDTSKGDNIIKWNWVFKDSLKNEFSNLHNPIYSYQYAGIYPVVLVIENKWNCIDTLIKTVTIASDFSFYLPNTFTPNNDNINDLFQPKGFGITKYEMSVFDRWGHLLFSSNDFFTGWDGKFKNEDCPNETYVWKAIISTANKQQKSFQGHVILLR